MLFLVVFLMSIPSFLYAPKHPIFNALDNANVTEAKKLLEADPHCMVEPTNNNLTAWQTLRGSLIGLAMAGAMSSVIARDPRGSNYTEIAWLFNATVPRLTVEEQQALREGNMRAQAALYSGFRR